MPNGMVLGDFLWIPGQTNLLDSETAKGRQGRVHQIDISNPSYWGIRVQIILAAESHVFISEELLSVAHVASLMLHAEHAATAEEPHNQSRKIGHEKFCILQIVVSSSRLEKYVCHVLTVHIFF